MFYIYGIVNLLNQKIYIGKTNNINRRFTDHIYTSKQLNKHKLHRAINKYGKEKFHIFEIDSNINENRIFELEKYYIEYFDSFKSGYNETIGGENPPIKIGNVPKEIILKLRELKLEINSFGGFIDYKYLSQKYDIKIHHLKKIFYNNSYKDPKYKPNSISNKITYVDNKIVSKICFSCRKDLPKSKYHKSKNTKSKLNGRCIDCVKLNIKNRKSINSNKISKNYDLISEAFVLFHIGVSKNKISSILNISQTHLSRILIGDFC